ncbi:hypothetical protein CONLIGDRAFT_673915, partial [Coniochaeta ligniaria NRRL 30616]
MSLQTRCRQATTLLPPRPQYAQRATGPSSIHYQWLSLWKNSPRMPRCPRIWYSMVCMGRCPSHARTATGYQLQDWLQHWLQDWLRGKCYTGFKLVSMPMASSSSYRQRTESHAARQRRSCPVSRCLLLSLAVIGLGVRTYASARTASMSPSMGKVELHVCGLNMMDNPSCDAACSVSEGEASM